MCQLSLLKRNYAPPPAFGATSRFTVGSHHPNVSLHLRLCQILYVLFPTVFCWWLSNSQIWWPWIRPELISVSWPWLNFQGHWRLLCFKFNSVYAIFPTVFCWWLSNSHIRWPRIRPWIKSFFCDCGSIFMVTGVIMFWKLTLIVRYFIQFFVNGFPILWYSDHEWDLEVFMTLAQFSKLLGVIMFKINFVYTIFPVVLCWWLSNKTLGKHRQDL